MIRLQRFLAEAGVASRRASEALILDGRVSVNGGSANELGMRVDPEHDVVKVDGRAVRRRRKLCVALNKPPGLVCTKNDPQGRRTIGELLPAEWSNLNSVGRLDYESEGLILLTNDGELALRLTHPRYGIQKKYVVIIDGPVAVNLPKALIKGVRHEGEMLRAARVRIVNSGSKQSSIELTLTGGKNREIRRMLSTLGISIQRLIRIEIGPIRLGELRLGRWRVLQEAEIRSLTKDEPHKAGTGGARFEN